MRSLKNGLANATLALITLFSSFSLAHASAGKVIGANAGLIPTSGTTSFYQGISWQGVSRSVLFIRPAKATSGKAPAIVMLHYDSGTPELQANLSHAGLLAAQMGYWVILPPAINGHWNDDPSAPNPTADDVGFLKTVIQTAAAQYPIDATRISMAGLSNGGFMTTRMACEQAPLIASIFVVAAEMGQAQAANCRPGRPVPSVYVVGTADTVVPYNGSIGLSGRRDISAPASFTNWMNFNACNTKQTLTQNLTPTVNDGTSITFQHNASCTSLGEADLYTVVNGGHAWPGGDKYIAPFGVASQNLDTTTVLGNFAKLWTTKSTI